MCFSEAVSFSSGLSGMSLKKEQLSAIKAVYEGRIVFCLFAHWIWEEQTLPFVMEHELGGDRTVIIVSALVAIILSSSSSVSKDNIGTSIPQSLFQAFRRITITCVQLVNVPL